MTKIVVLWVSFGNSFPYCVGQCWLWALATTLRLMAKIILWINGWMTIFGTMCWHNNELGLSGYNYGSITIIQLTTCLFRSPLLEPCASMIPQVSWIFYTTRSCIFMGIRWRYIFLRKEKLKVFEDKFYCYLHTYLFYRWYYIIQFRCSLSESANYREIIFDSY